MNLKPFSEWPNPKKIGQSEYSMIYDLCNIARKQAINDGDDPDMLTISILEEFFGWAQSLLGDNPKQLGNRFR